jgi:hypothetical protein
MYEKSIGKIYLLQKNLTFTWQTALLYQEVNQAAGGITLARILKYITS